MSRIYLQKGKKFKSKIVFCKRMKIQNNKVNKEAYKVDEKDRKILRAIARDARAPMTKVAKKVGLSRQSVEYRLKQMENAGLLAGSRTVINVRKFGFFSYHVFVELRDEEHEKELITRCKDAAEVNALAQYIGKWTFEIAIMARDPAEFHETFERITRGLTITRYSFGIILSTLKAAVLPTLQNHDERKAKKSKTGYTPDSKDAMLLDMLAMDATQRLTTLAEKMQLTSEATKQRIKKLVENDYIQEFRPVINYSVVGMSIQCMLIQGRPREARFEEWLASQRNVLWCAKTVGNYDFILYVLTNNIEEFQDVANDLKQEFGRTITSFDLLFGSQNHKYAFWSKNIKEKREKKS